MTTPAAPTSGLWYEWGRITRFLESARLAFARERNLWHSLEIERPSDIKLTAPAGQGNYKVALTDHLGAMDDEVTLFAAVLIQSYALAEFAAAKQLGDKNIRRIEDWGKRLLAANGKSWADVVGDLPGAVQVAVVRNAFAHGTHTIDETAVNRLKDAGAPSPRVGTIVSLTYEELRQFRSCLLSLLRLGAVR